MIPVSNLDFMVPTDISNALCNTRLKLELITISLFCLKITRLKTRKTCFSYRAAFQLFTCFTSIWFFWVFLEHKSNILGQFQPFGTISVFWDHCSILGTILAFGDHSSVLGTIPAILGQFQHFWTMPSLRDHFQHFGTITKFLRTILAFWDFSSVFDTIPAF